MTCLSNIINYYHILSPFIIEDAIQIIIEYIKDSILVTKDGKCPTLHDFGDQLLIYLNTYNSYILNKIPTDEFLAVRGINTLSFTYQIVWKCYLGLDSEHQYTRYYINEIYFLRYKFEDEDVVLNLNIEAFDNYNFYPDRCNILSTHPAIINYIKFCTPFNIKIKEIDSYLDI